MNFGIISNRLQRYERAKAKLNEFSVSDESRRSNKLIMTSSNELLYSTIRVLSQFVEKFCDNQDCDDLYKELSFVAQFYENYVAGEAPDSDYFFLLTGAAANILSDNFGNAKSLIDKIKQEDIENDIACLLFDYIATGLGKTLKILYLREDLRENYYFPLINEIKGEDNSNLIINLKQLSLNLLFDSDEESAFFSLILCAIQKKFLNNSATRIIPAASNSLLKNWSRYFAQSNAIRILWQAQKLLVDGDVLKGKSATVQLPTGVGKTKSIELIVSAAFLIRNVNLAIVVAPLRALCNEIEKDLQRSLKNIVEITALTDVLDDENLDFTHKRVIVLTPEKLSFLIRHNSDLLKRCGLIIFDEAHMFDDQSRGAAYEFLILQVNDGLQSDAQKVFISAIMPNAEDLNDWLTNDGSIVTDSEIKKTEKSIAFYSKATDRLLFYQQKELIEFKDEMIYIPQVCPRTPDIREDYVRGKNKGEPKYVFPNLSKGSDVALFLACKLSNRGNCSAIYVNSPKQIFSIAKNIIKLKSKKYYLLDNIYQNSNHEENRKIYDLAILHFGENSEIVQMMELGFFPHFGDLENGLRISIEYEIRRHNIACVICTSTLAEGVNLPIRYLFLTSLQDTFGQMLSIRKFQNLIGRTARSGVHTEGSLICTDFKYYDNKIKDAEQWKSVVNLFNASKSEHCNSSVLQLFDDLKIPYTGASLDGIWLFKEFIRSYSNSTLIDINNWVEKVYSNHVSNYVKREVIKEGNDIKKNIFDSIASRLNQIKHIVDVIESIILDEYTNEDTEVQDIQIFAQKTLAYKMADENEKELIALLFQTIAQKVQGISIEKRKVFAKALSSIEILNKIDSYLKNLFNDRYLFKFNESEWIDILIDLSDCYFNSKYGFGKQNNNVKRSIIKTWINGDNYQQIMLCSGLKLNEIIKICQNEISYTFNLLLSSIIELIQQYRPDNLTNTVWEQYMDELHLFQQRIKYGLKNESDRMIIQDENWMQKDFEGIYLITPTNLTQMYRYDSENKYGDLLRYLYQQQIMYLNQKITYGNYRENVLIGFKKWFYNDSTPINNKNSDLYYHTAQYTVQAVGRICRCKNKNKNIYIFADVEVVERLQKVEDTLLKGIYNSEFLALLNTQIKNERQYSVEEYSQQNRNANGFIYNNSCLLRSSKKRVLDWQELRDYVLRNPTVKYVDDRYFKLYYKFDVQQSGYCYAVGENFKIVDIKLNTYADMLQVSQHDCGLSRMLEVYEVRKMFEDNNFATIWRKNDYIMTPSLYNQIYKGALGEAVGKCILNKYSGYKVEEIEDYSLYELFDFKIKNVYIDFKHWKDSPAKLKPQIEKIKRKLNRVKGEKAVIINILKRGKHKAFLNSDGDVLEIPYLINDENEVDLDMLEEIGNLIIDD